MAKHANRCRTCVHYNLPAVTNAAGAVIGSKAAKCLWPMPDDIYPASVPQWERQKVGPGYMQPNDGENCTKWEQRT